MLRKPSRTTSRVTWTFRMDCFSTQVRYWTSGTGAGPTYWLALSASRARSRPAPVRSKMYAARLGPLVPSTSTSRRCWSASSRSSTKVKGSRTAAVSCRPVRTPWT